MAEIVAVVWHLGQEMKGEYAEKLARCKEFGTNEWVGKLRDMFS